MKAFLVGLGQGIGLGVLFAPMSGEETRGNLSERANEFAKTARENVEQGKERAQRILSSFRSGAVRPTGTDSGV
jgi:gas vesicle protein